MTKNIRIKILKYFRKYQRYFKICNRNYGINIKDYIKIGK